MVLVILLLSSGVLGLARDSPELEKTNGQLPANANTDPRTALAAADALAECVGKGTCGSQAGDEKTASDEETASEAGDEKTASDEETAMLKKKALDGALSRKAPVWAQSNSGYTSAFYNLAHMVNSLYLINWALDTCNSKSVEIDIRYSHHPSGLVNDWMSPLTTEQGGAQPLITHHGPPCDCVCSVIYHVWNSWGVCNAMDEDSRHTLTLCHHNSPLTTMLGEFARRQPAAIYFDNKMSSEEDDAWWSFKRTSEGFKAAGMPGHYYSGQVDNSQWMYTGMRLGMVITRHLYWSGYAGISMVGVQDDREARWLTGLLWGYSYAGDWALDKLWVCWDMDQSASAFSMHEIVWQNHGVKTLIGAYIAMGNAWTRTVTGAYWKVAASKGITTCFWILGDDEWNYVHEAVWYRDDSYGIDFVMTWTVDVRGDMWKGVNKGLDGMITNYPVRLNEVVNSFGVYMPLR